jgi:phage-related protein
MSQKKISVVFFQTETGKEPVKSWLKSLDEQEKKTIGEDIKTVEYGWPIGMPVCRSLGKGLYEVRSNLPTNKIARVIFCVSDGYMILLHGFIKKDKKTPDPARIQFGLECGGAFRTPKSDLDLALKRKKQLGGNDE